jgi:hypothetical protein
MDGRWEVSDIGLEGEEAESGTQEKPVGEFQGMDSID